LASLVSLWWGVRVAFFRVAMQAGSSSSSSSSSESVTMEPAYVPFGIPLLLIIIGIYTLLGFALYIRRYSAFRLVAGAHVVFSLLSLPSVGMLFLPASGLLLLAIIFSFVLPDRRINRLVRHHDA